MQPRIRVHWIQNLPDPYPKMLDSAGYRPAPETLDPVKPLLDPHPAWLITRLSYQEMDE